MSKPHEQDLVALRNAVRYLREQRGMSARELADASGIERLRISTLEAGGLDPTYELLISLTEGLGVQLSALVICAENDEAPRRSAPTPVSSEVDQRVSVADWLDQAATRLRGELANWEGCVLLSFLDISTWRSVLSWVRRGARGRHGVVACGLRMRSLLRCSRGARR